MPAQMDHAGQLLGCCCMTNRCAADLLELRRGSSAALPISTAQQYAYHVGWWSRPVTAARRTHPCITATASTCNSSLGSSQGVQVAHALTACIPWQGPATANPSCCILLADNRGRMLGSEDVVVVVKEAGVGALQLQCSGCGSGAHLAHACLKGLCQESVLLAACRLQTCPGAAHRGGCSGPCARQSVRPCHTLLGHLGVGVPSLRAASAGGRE